MLSSILSLCKQHYVSFSDLFKFFTSRVTLYLRDIVLSEGRGTCSAWENSPNSYLFTLVILETTSLTLITVNSFFLIRQLPKSS